MKASQRVEDRIQLISAVAHLMMVDPPKSQYKSISNAPKVAETDTK